jgi:pimeloyl-ACP methyl ester carboxylesterase
MKLAFDRLDGERPQHTIIFLHGMLGRGVNLRTLATRFVQDHPDWTAVLVDLRGHGRSPKGTQGASLEAAARDVIELAAARQPPVTAIAGHSFGGKVALEVARLGELAALHHLVVIDSMPGAWELMRGGDGVLGIIDTIASISNVFTSITGFVAALRSAGLSRTVSQWLAGSLEKTGDNLRFGLDPGEIRALALDYAARDLWSVIEHPPGELQVHLVVGERSDTYTEADRERANRAAASNSRVTVDLLRAGHWVHVDDLDGLLRVMHLRVGSTRT